MKLTFADKALEDYIFWQDTDRKMVKKINGLIKDITRTPFSGLGKPEPLKHEWSSCWSRRIDEQHRMIYRVSDDQVYLELVSLRYHYGDH